MASLATAAQLSASRRVSLRVQPKAPRAVRATRLICRAADKAQVLSDVRSIVAEQLGTDLDKVTAETKFADLGADSLDTVEILMAFEEKFDVQIDEEQAQKISTVQEAADAIAANIK